MKWNKDYLDLFLVPSGLFIMFGYHLFLLHRYLRHSGSTVLGYENHCKKNWVKKIMQVDTASRGPAFTVISATIAAATYLASVSLALSSLIGTWVGSTSTNQLVSKILYGDTRIAVTSIKYISMLLFFLLAFASFIQTARCYVHANFLLSMPDTELPEKHVYDALVSGASFWELGLRAIYFAITFMMWMFGPIPMFLSCVGTVLVLQFIDYNKIPLDEFKDLFKKVEEEITTMTKGSERHGHGREVRASVTTAVMSTTTY